LRGVPPDHTQISVGDRLTGDKPVHRVLVTRVAELHHDIVGHLGQPRISQQQLQRIVMVLQAVQLPIPTSRCPVKASSTTPASSAGRGHRLTLIRHAALEPAGHHACHRRSLDPIPAPSRSGEPDGL